MNRFLLATVTVIFCLNANSQKIRSIPITESIMYLITGKDTFLLQKIKTTDTLKDVRTVTNTAGKHRIHGKLIEIRVRDGEIDTLKNKDIDFTDAGFTDLYKASDSANYYSIEPLTTKIYFQREIHVETGLDHINFLFLYSSQEQYDNIVSFILTDLMKEAEPTKLLFYKKNLFETAK